MLYYLFNYLDRAFDFPGAGVFHYISFRAAMALITSLVISLLFGKRIIEMIRRKQIGETIRELGLEGQSQKKGTPTMGGLIILAAIIIPTLLFAKIHNVYIILMLYTSSSCSSLQCGWESSGSSTITSRCSKKTRRV
jgi:phospho-N-acetylmuramoyl-pentapeptide-transferase